RSIPGVTAYSPPGNIGISYRGFGTGSVSQLFNGIGGPEYIYSLLVGYNGSEKEQAGAFLYGNDVYPGGYLSMAQPLWGEDVEYAVYGEGGDYTPPEPTLEQEAEDVSAFLMWAAEPKLGDRKQAGLRNFVLLIALAVLLYYTNKQIWASVKGKD
ncbi:MAG: cytochrome c1, partial [Pseudomonadota bacterium]